MSGRVKTPYFTELEKSVLLELVELRKEVLESKVNDGRMVEKKNKEWEKLTEDFNSRHGVNKRKDSQLKSLWKNLKARTKSAVAKDRRERTKTGEGTATPALDKISTTIIEMLPQQINSLQNAFDDDASLHGDTREEANDAEISVTEDCNNNIQEEVEPVPCTSASVKLSDKGGVKRKPAAGRQDVVKSRLLEMAEEEHAMKMEVLQLKKEVLQLKRRKLEEQVGNNDRSFMNSDSGKNNASTWRPF